MSDEACFAGKQVSHMALWKRIHLQCRRPGFHPWVGKVPWKKEWYPLQYSCLENSMDRGAWRAAVHGVAKSWAGLSDFHWDEDLATWGEIIAQDHTAHTWVKHRHGALAHTQQLCSPRLRLFLVLPLHSSLVLFWPNLLPPSVWCWGSCYCYPILQMRTRKCRDHVNPAEHPRRWRAPDSASKIHYFLAPSSAI